MSDLTISIRGLHALVDPVIPFAGQSDDLPVLNSVRIESRGTHLVAFTTDRFRLAAKRLACEEGATWPEWSATIPLRTLRAIFQTYKAKRFAEPQITLAVDNGTLRVQGDDALLDLLDATVTYPLTDGEYPKVAGLFATALAAEPEEHSNEVAFNPKFLADFAKASSPTVSVRVTSRTAPVLFADGDDFLALLMPRKREGTTAFPVLDDWTDLLTPKAAQKKRTRKSKGAAA